MLNKNLLKAAIARAGMTQGDLAYAIGIASCTLSAKMSGTYCFNTDEIDAICNVLDITDNAEKASIFLDRPSQNRDGLKKENKPMNELRGEEPCQK